MSRARTELTDYLIYGVDEKYRRVYFGSLGNETEEGIDEPGEITQGSIEYCVRAIERMATDGPRTPIEIHMNSYGGDPYALLALYDVIQSCTCQIKFFGKGAIMSAATWIMCGCDERYLYPNTRIMVHKGWEEHSGSMTDIEISVDESRRLQEKLEEIYAENSRMPKQFWNEVCKRDLNLSAEETILLGLADKIVQAKKRGNYRKMRQHHLSQKIDKRKMNKLITKLMERIQAAHKIEITINEPKQEPVDETLVIEPMPVETKIDKEEKNDSTGA